jgi:hypothetical protein
VFVWPGGRAASVRATLRVALLECGAAPRLSINPLDAPVRQAKNKIHASPFHVLSFTLAANRLKAELNLPK